MTSDLALSEEQIESLRRFEQYGHGPGLHYHPSFEPLRPFLTWNWVGPVPRPPLAEYHYWRNAAGELFLATIDSERKKAVEDERRRTEALLDRIDTFLADLDRQELQRPASSYMALRGEARDVRRALEATPSTEGSE